MPMKSFAMALALATLTMVPAQAQFRGPGAPSITTVALAAEAREDTQVVLTGHIIDRQDDEYYTFRDDTGTITVEIDLKLFAGREVTPETRVRLTGEVDDSRRGRHVDVDVLDIL